MQRITTETT